MTILNTNSDTVTANIFFDDDGPSGIVRYDEVKYPAIKRMAKTMRGFYWAPEEVDINKDRGDFLKLSDAEKHIFTNSLRRIILFESIQGRGPAEMLIPVTSSPELENAAVTWTFFENIHSESYTHIIQNVYAVSREVFEGIADIPEITDSVIDIVKYYDDYAKEMYLYKLMGFGQYRIENEQGEVTNIGTTPYSIKRKLWLMLMSINIMEGLQFYSNFLCFFNFAETKKLEGSAKLIKLISRDEQLHLSLTQKLLKNILIKDDPEFEQIRLDTLDECHKIFHEAIRKEKEWARYIFSKGSMIGLNEVLLCEYIDYLGAQRMRAVGLTPDFKYPASNPMRWVNSWLNTGSTQVASQETEQTMYVIGAMDQDVVSDSFSGFNL